MTAAVAEEVAVSENKKSNSALKRERYQKRAKEPEADEPLADVPIKEVSEEAKVDAP